MRLTGVLMLWSVALFAQKSEILNVEGFVQDQEGNPLTSATAVLLDPIDSTMISFGICNADGRFLMRRVDAGSYLLQISYVGFQTMEKSVEVLSGHDPYSLGQLQLEPAALDAVTVTADRIPMTINKDTIVYNADAFRTQPNDVVEDLLRKMPGIEVEDDGTIKAQGEEVQSVLVDGKEFFGGDTKIATKNLPAKAVDKVEVFDRKSDIAEFTGIDDGQEQKAINLELKEDHKKGLFGTLTGGYGTEDRYTGQTTLNRFDRNTQVSFIGMLNNVNRQGFSTDDYIQFAGGMANLVRNSGGNGVRLGGDGLAIADGLSDGFVETGAAGINFNHDFSKKTQLNLSYFISDIENDIDQIANRENIVSGRQSFFSEDRQHEITENVNHRLNSVFDHKIDSNQNIRFRATLAFNNSAKSTQSTTEVRTLNGAIGNQGVIDNSYNGDNVRYNGQLTYRRRFSKRGRSLSLSANYRNQADEQIAYLETFQRLANRMEGFDTTLIEQDQFQTNDLDRYGWNLNYIEPLGRNKYLGLEYTRSNDANQVKRDVYDELDGYELISELSNHYHRDYRYDRIGSSLRWIKGKSNFSVNLNFQNSLLLGEILSSELEIKQKYFNFVPRVRWDFDLSNSQRLRLNYMTSVDEPSLTQLQPIADNSNPLSIYVGNPDLQPSYTHRLQMRYFSFSQFSMTNVFATVTGSYTNNPIVNSRIIDETFRQITTPLNVDNSWRLSSFVGFGTPMKWMGSRINVHLNYSYSRNIVFVNQVEDFASRNNTSINVSFDNLKKEIIDLRVGADIGGNTTRYQESTNQNQEYLNQTYYGDLAINLGTNFAIGSRFDYRIFSGGTRTEAQRVPLWEASVSAFVLRQKGELKLSAFDLLNRNVGIQQNVDLNYIEDVRIRSLGQYFMLSFTWAINQFARQEDSGRSRNWRIMRGGGRR